MKSNRFTLIEVLLALAIAGIGAMGVLRLQIIGLEAAIYSEHAVRAALIAESKIDKAIADSRAQERPPEPDSGLVEDDPRMNFRWELDVNEGPADFDYLPGPVSDLRVITCRVRWGGEGDSARTTEVRRYVWESYYEE